jgi:integrase
LAVEWNVITKVPKITLLTGEHQRDYVLSDDAIQQFSKEPDLIGRIVPFLVDTGLRRGETCALTWEAVNFAERWVYISKGKTKYARRNTAHQASRSDPARAESHSQHAVRFHAERPRSHHRRLAVPQFAESPAAAETA